MKEYVIKLAVLDVEEQKNYGIGVTIRRGQGIDTVCEGLEHLNRAVLDKINDLEGTEMEFFVKISPSLKS